MCGRFALNRGLGQLRSYINARAVNTNGRTFNPSNNIAPGSSIPVVTHNEVNVCVWGVERLEHTMPNARSENVRNIFRDDIESRRCVVPADGYFEWDSSGQPYFFKRSNELLFLAAFYNNRGRCCILTRDASNQVKGVHRRMPIIFNLAQIALWDSKQHWGEMLSSNPPSLDFYPVMKMALRPGYSGPECITQIKVKKQLGLLQFVKSKTKEKEVDTLVE